MNATDHDKNIATSRASGRFLDALTCLDEVYRTNRGLGETQAAIPWRRHIAGERCLILEAARECRADPQPFFETIDRLVPGIRSTIPEHRIPPAT